MGIIKTNDNFEHPEGKIQLLNGTVLDCYPLEQAGERVDNQVRLDTTGTYFAIGGKKPTAAPRSDEEKEAERNLFVNNAFRMDFYVPNSEYTLDEVIPEFDWSVKPSGGTVKIQMPKFTMECKNDIRQLLESCGMKEMFNVGVFDRMTSKDNDAYIQNIKQDVKIKVEESGVEAVAVTLGFLNTRSGPYNFDIDRPFVFAIRDNASGSFLFMGRVNDIN